MAQNRTVAPRPLNVRDNRPSGAREFQLTDRRKVTPKQSRARPDFTDAYKTLGAFSTNATKTAAIAPTSTDVGVPVPIDAVAVIVLVQINTNTTTAGTVSFYSYMDLNDSGGLGGGAVGIMRVTNVSATGSYINQVICPLVGGKLYWEVGVTGAVAYDCNLRLAGFIRA